MTLTPEMKEWLHYSITIGSFKIQPVDVVIALITFIAFRVFARLCQSLLHTKIFPRTHLDSGLKDSIITFTGYISTLLGLLIAMSILGINLSSIALIAGALSVGIGFGLQNIVNNFVSGIILLIERPVKVGDWVVVGLNEGIITSIRVRSTEIETFHRATVIIPNSDLLQNAVKNWSHHDRMARIDIPVTVDYTSNIEQLEEALLACAKDYPGALKNPAPSVNFRDFSPTGLLVELRFFIEDVSNTVKYSSDIRKRVLHALTAANIRIPFSNVEMKLTGESPDRKLQAAKPGK
jgi:small-conductance mechanosensitive channel